jgi:hypothetical protein
MNGSAQSSAEALAMSVRLCASVGVDADDPDLAYINVAAAAVEACRLSMREPDSIAPMLQLAEATLDGDDAELRTLIVIGLLEDMQNALLRGEGDTDAVLSRLGPRSTSAWFILERRWSGDPAAFGEDR